MDRGFVLGFAILLVYAVLTAAGVSWAQGSPDAEGSARIELDGQTATYELRTGFDWDTDFNNPKRSTLVFSLTDWEGGANPRRIQLTLDSTRTGSRSTAEDRVFFKFIEDGGQHFPPKDSCAIEIRSAYSGTPSSLFAGRIDDCQVISAGIEHVVSVDFRMKGIPKPY